MKFVSETIIALLLNIQRTCKIVAHIFDYSFIVLKDAFKVLHGG